MSDFFRPAGSGYWTRKFPLRAYSNKPKTKVPKDISVSCPHCGEELRVEAKYIGYTMACPYCEQKFVADAPAPGKQPGKKPAGKKQEPASAGAPAGTDLLQEEEELLNQQPGALSDDIIAGAGPGSDAADDADVPAGMKKCPFCAELIKAEATLCKHCKSKLDE